MDDLVLQALGAPGMAAVLAEVRADALAQVDGLADVERLARGPLEEVDPGDGGKFGEVERTGFDHPFSTTRQARSMTILARRQQGNR
ncbi:hypothetical protein D3C86_1946190 [compost metagenome]